MDNNVSQNAFELVQRFESAYNAIDKYLRCAVDRDKAASFSGLLSEYRRRHPNWTEGAFLSQVAEIRNFIVHEKTKPNQYLALPTPSCVVGLEKIRDRLLSPSRVIPTFRKEVATVSSEDTVASVLKLVTTRDFSQFPVYDSGKFKGLLTENGITRWLAGHVSFEDSLVELKDIAVREVLKQEEKRQNCAFVVPATPVDDVRAVFGENRFLEAVLITNAGRRDEKPLGIVTRWDI